METKLFTISDKINDISYQLEKYVPEDKYQKRQNKLNKNINKLKNKVSDLNLEIAQLKEKQWKYELGTLLILNNFKVVRVIGRIDKKGYLYKVIDNFSCDLTFREFIQAKPYEIKLSYSYDIKAEDILQAYKDEFDYIALLKTNNEELRDKLEQLKKKL